MNYNIKDILPYLEILKLNKNNSFTEEDGMLRIEDYYEKDKLYLPSFFYEEGCTKFVIIPEHLDYVIKIPYNALINGRNKKIFFENGGGEEYWDYCAKELEIYNHFKEFCVLNGKEKYINFLLPIEEIDYINYPVYIQPKVETYEEVDGYYTSEKSIHNVVDNKMNLSSLPNEWLATCLEKLDNNMKELELLCDYIRKNEITDLHSGNIGYYNKFPVIIDYGGFSENTSSW